MQNTLQIPQSARKPQHQRTSTKSLFGNLEKFNQEYQLEMEYESQMSTQCSLRSDSPKSYMKTTDAWTSKMSTDDDDCSWRGSLRSYRMSPSPQPMKRQHVPSPSPQKQQRIFQAGGQLWENKLPGEAVTEEKIYAIPDDVELFDNKRKHMKLPNLMDTDKYHQEDSFRFQVKWLNKPGNYEKLAGEETCRDRLQAQHRHNQQQIRNMRA